MSDRGIWESKHDPLRTILLAHGHPALHAGWLEEVRATLQGLTSLVLEDLTGQLSRIDSDADFAVVIGGDGSILRSVSQLGHRQIPILGVNVGRLGFLADVSPRRFAIVLREVIQGRCRIVSHLMFRCRLERQGEIIQDVLGLNEAAVLRGPPFSMLDVDLFIDDDLVTTYSCDGLIISTPVGSTAHSLSAGGPILQKSMAAFVVCPLSPHTLTVRPLVDSDEHVYAMVVRDPQLTTSLVVDGRMIQQLEPGDRVLVEKADPRFQLIEAIDRGYYRTLREKLGWGGQMKRSPDSPAIVEDVE